MVPSLLHNTTKVGVRDEKGGGGGGGGGMGGIKSVPEFGDTRRCPSSVVTYNSFQRNETIKLKQIVNYICILTLKILIDLSS